MNSRRIYRKKISCADDLFEWATAYFNDCDSKLKIYDSDDGKGARVYVEPKTKVGLAAFLGIARTTLDKYQGYEGYEEVMEWIYSQIESDLVVNGLKGNCNNKMTEVILKNHHDYEDKKQIDTRNLTQESYENYLIELKEARKLGSIENKVIEGN